MTNKKAINFDLSSIADGGLQEKVDRALEKVTSNILDRNTEATKKRKVTVNITLAPNDNRDSVDVVTEVKTTLAPDVGVATTLLVGEDHGQPVANELKSGVIGQTYIDAEDGTLKTDIGESVDEVEKQGANKDATDKVIDFQKGKEA